MKLSAKICVLLLCVMFRSGLSFAQFTVSGTVYDSSKLNPVKDVTIQSNYGNYTLTDSMGHYDIVTNDADSITFIYQNKPTAKFAVKQIVNIGSFDISLLIHVTPKYKSLKEVRVYSKSFKQDSIDNREHYAKIFNFQKPGFKTTSSSYSGSAGLDLDELINTFRFRRNRQLKYMQKRLLEEEQERFINYRFNKTLIRRMTKLEGTDLDRFVLLYRPDFEFTQNSSTLEFYQYILTASYQFKSMLLQNKP